MLSKMTIQAHLCVAITLLSSINYAYFAMVDETIATKMTSLTKALSGDVNISFEMPSHLVNTTSPRLLTITVMNDKTKQRLRTIRTDILAKKFTVTLPCDLFDHAGIYSIIYKVSQGGPTGRLNQTLNLKWGDIRIESPLNHTTLTRFGSIWIYHDRLCLPKSRRYRDQVVLYYMKGKGKVIITNRIVRKVKNGRQKGHRKRIRMGFSCDLFDIAQSYYFEYVSGYNNRSLSTSRPVNVQWSKHTLYTPSKTIFPCKNSFMISFAAPECHRTTDIIAVYEQSSGRYISQRPALPGHSAVFFTCTLFKEYIKAYCFRYISKTADQGEERIQASMCVSTLAPGKSIYDGWSSWSFWNLCSNSCGQGRQYRYRFCLSLTTSKDKSRACAGRAVMSKPCVLRPCPETRNACSCGCTLTGSEGMITSSPQLFKKPGRTQCTWRINMPGNKRVKLWFDALKLEGDAIFVRDGNDSSADLLAKIKTDNYEQEIISTGNTMYLHYYHNGKWINGTRRGFTASYKVEDATQIRVIATRKKSLGTAEISFLAIFIVGIIIMGTLLLIVFVKLRRQHSYSTSSGSSTTSESTIRSAATPLPIEDGGSSEPLNKQQRKKHTKPKRDNLRQKQGKHVGRHDLICDGNPIPRCSCAAVCGDDSGSLSTSVSSPQRRNSNLYRTLERTTIQEECTCPQCDIQRTCQVHEHFGLPEKKYFGDWMVQESYLEDQRHVNRHSFPQYV